MHIREAVRGDENAVYGLICELAEYEKAPQEVVNTPEQLRKDLFEDQVCDALVVELNGRIIGFALFYTGYSTWKGKTLYLEDFYIQPEHRNSGIGSDVFRKVVDIAKKRGVRRMDWQVLDWNEPAIQFYKKHHAILDPEWMNGRLFFGTDQE